MKVPELDYSDVGEIEGFCGTLVPNITEEEIETTKLKCYLVESEVRDQIRLYVDGRVLWLSGPNNQDSMVMGRIDSYRFLQHLEICTNRYELRETLTNIVDELDDMEEQFKDCLLFPWTANVKTKVNKIRQLMEEGL